jgi:hypothetical protein
MSKQKIAFELTTEREYTPGHIQIELHMASTTDDLGIDDKIIGGINSHFKKHGVGTVYTTTFYHQYEDGQITVRSSVDHDTFGEALATLMKAIVIETGVV